ncbi:MAG TPA: dihydrofolate reductase family protein [Chitinophaga sp.]
MKPYIICHMLCSIDGRIQTDRWNQGNGFEHYEKTGKLEKADGWMCGRITMEQHFAARRPELPSVATPVARIDYVADATASSFAIAVDAAGKLGWDSAEIDGDHVIAVLTEQVPDAYVAYLQQQGVSYIFGGKTGIDFSVALEKLNRLFNIKKLLLEGGGKINGALHAAGLIDAYSVLYYPIADGSSSPTLIDTDAKDAGRIPVTELELTHLEQLDKQVVWMKYNVIK